MGENLDVFKGDTLSFGVEITGLEGQDLEQAYFTVKQNKEDAVPLIRKTLGTYIWKDSYDAATDSTKYGVRVEPAAMDNLDPGYYFYDFQIGLNGDRFTILSGKLLVKKDVTED